MDNLQKRRNVIKSSHEKVEFQKTAETVLPYEADGHKVEITLKEFVPMHEVSEDKALIFFTGWSASDAKTLEYLSGRFAVDADSKVLQVRTATEGIRSGALRGEARAVVEKIIRERGLKEITIASHSEGGVKAANIIDILQKGNPDVEIKGLILMDPVGLYEQTPRELVSAFAADSLIATPKTILTNVLNKKPATGRGLLIKQGLQAATDIVFNAMREIRRAKLDFPEKFRGQIAGMAGADENFEKVKCPVVLIQGAADPVSSHEKVLPSETDPRNLTARSEILKKAFFPNSPRVDMLVPEKLGHHGLPHFRPEEISRASLYLLKREERRNHKTKDSQDGAL